MLKWLRATTLTSEEEDVIASTPPTRLLRRAMARNVHRARNGFVLLMVFVLVAIGIIYRYQVDLCRESHRRWTTLHAVIVTSTTLTPIALARLPQEQINELKDYELDLRGRLFISLGDPPDC